MTITEQKAFLQNYTGKAQALSLIHISIVSQETGRLARLVQNMLDITKLEAGEVPIHAKNYDLWQTVTDVVLSDEQRIEDGKIDIQGLGGPPLMRCV